MKLSKKDIIEFSESSTRPVIAGVYFLISKKNEIVYVGSSLDVLARLQAHKKKRLFARHFIIRFLKDNPEERYRMEEYYINKFEPKLNIKKMVRGSFKINKEPLNSSEELKNLNIKPLN